MSELDERPCPIPSAITGEPCLLPWGHGTDSPTRFHRYASPTPYAGQIVHVSSPGFCRVGLVLAPGKPGGSSRIRVFVQGIVEAGRDDFEGDFRHRSNPVHVPNPPVFADRQQTRTLDTWHSIEDCSNGA